MALLLDTNVVVFGLLEPRKVPRRIREMIEAVDVACLVSVVSLYEINLKAARGRLAIPAQFDLLGYLAAAEVGVLDLRPVHALRAAALPLVNRDPWDRLIVAQCLVDGHQLVSADTRIAGLGLTPLW